MERCKLRDSDQKEGVIKGDITSLSKYSHFMVIYVFNVLSVLKRKVSVQVRIDNKSSICVLVLAYFCLRAYS